MKSIFEEYPIENGSYDDAVTYVRVLIYVANVDGTSKDELTGIKYLIKAHKWPNNCYDDALKNPLSSIKELNLSEETKKVFGPYLIRDSIAVALIEEGYNEVEKNLISKVAEELGINSNQLQKIESAVDNQISATRIWSEVIQHSL